MKTTVVPVLVTLFILLITNTGIAGTIPPVKVWPKVYDVQIAQKAAHIVLQWKADNEPKEIYYEIETSADGKTYKSFAIVLGGFNEEAHYNYKARMKQAVTTKTYYRIKQVNNDGTYRIVSEQSL
jgi:hypothetical protein